MTKFLISYQNHLKSLQIIIIKTTYFNYYYVKINYVKHNFLLILDYLLYHFSGTNHQKMEV